MMVVHFRTAVPRVMTLFVAAILTVSGCSETPSAATQSPAASTTTSPGSRSEPVNSGDENGPAVSKPLEEPPVETDGQKPTTEPGKG